MTTEAPAKGTEQDTADDQTVEGTPLAALLLEAGVAKATVGAALKAAEMHANAEATPEQLKRAAEPPKGLAGKALATYVLTGENLKAQTAKAQTTRAEAAKAERAAARTAGGPREGGALHAAMAILKGAREPLTPQEIYDRAAKRGLVGGLKGKTPVATMAAQLATANKRGQYVERPAPGRYTLRKAGK